MVLLACAFLLGMPRLAEENLAACKIFDGFGVRELGTAIGKDQFEKLLECLFSEDFLYPCEACNNVFRCFQTPLPPFGPSTVSICTIGTDGSSLTLMA